MTRRPPLLTIHQKWLVGFGVWLLFLSGGLSSFLGSPGILQAVRLKNLLESKKIQQTSMRTELRRAQSEATLLENNRLIQLREIRRVLGYAAPDELIFDFKAPDQF